eukprot:TRINITY_DN8189_c0_g1_i1.p1 TRINITY_DN8189_c0_g1~~TRINITY_DN8189_c0_g1_i1.p1  ORF type:complete len:351 (+),score=89.36 TRINITY_DN8189_c0_g1_i1:351-1403(+)
MKKSNHHPLKNGELVYIDKKEFMGKAKVSYFGDITNKKGDQIVYVGLIFDKAVGDSNGEIEGKRYFECEMNYGLFCRPFEIKRIMKKKKKKVVKKNKMENRKTSSILDLEPLDCQVLEIEEMQDMDVYYNLNDNSVMDEEDEKLQLAIALSLSDNNNLLDNLNKKNGGSDQHIYEDIFSKILTIIQQDEKNDKDIDKRANKYNEIKEIVLKNENFKNLPKDYKNGSVKNGKDSTQIITKTNRDTEYPVGFIINLIPMSPIQPEDNFEEVSEYISEEKKQKMAKRRSFIIAEMIKTEEDYIRDLDIFESVYMYGLDVLITQTNIDTTDMTKNYKYDETMQMFKPFSDHLLH